MPFTTHKEVLQLAANWRRIMSVVGQPDALEERMWGCSKGGRTLSSVDGNSSNRAESKEARHTTTLSR